LNGNDFYKVIELPVFANLRAGFHQEITIEIDYGRWFGFVDFAKDSPEIIQKKWFNNLVNSFKVITVLEQID
jgi:hypothetical protein